MSWRDLVGHLLTREVMTFLGVGGTGYIVDVVAFNVLRSLQPLAGLDPSVARTLAVAVGMCVTYCGNRSLTWRNHASDSRPREVSLFVLVNIVGFGFSVVMLVLSHDVLGFTSRLADNISANVVGLALGTTFRYVTYKRYVFASPPTEPPSRSQGFPKADFATLAPGPEGDNHGDRPATTHSRRAPARP